MYILTESYIFLDKTIVGDLIILASEKNDILEKIVFLSTVLSKELNNKDRS